MDRGRPTIEELETTRGRARRRNVGRRFAQAFILATVMPAIGFAAQDPVLSFAGRWDLTLTSPTGNLPSWIEVSERQGKVSVLFVGVTDHATQMKQAEIRNGALSFVSPKGEEGFPLDTTYTLKPAGAELKGTVSNDEKNWSVVGKSAPALTRKTVVHWGKPVRLFNGRDFAGWKFSDPKMADSWKIEDGMLVSNGHGSEIISIPEFEDFKLHLEFNTGPTSNSGVFLRGRYEVQIETDSESEPPSHHTGGVYGFLDPTPEQPRTADKWQSFDITLIGRIVTVVQNGITIINQKEIPGITGGALDSNEGLPGPIYLQGTEAGRVSFRNIVVAPAKD
jgi:Domain of Unknown Function (DUF1080)